MTTFLKNDFMFQLNKNEKTEVVTNCDHLQKLKFSPVNPLVFTEHGALMAASILNSARAVEVSLFIVRAFVALRRMISEHKELAREIAQLERKLADHDDQIIAIIQAIKELSGPQPVPENTAHGFHQIPSQLKPDRKILQFAKIIGEIKWQNLNQ